MPLYSITKWFWWMSNDPYAWPSGAVYDAKNVDLSESKGVKLSRSFNLSRPQLLFTSAQWFPVALIEWNQQTNQLIASRNGWLKNWVQTEINIQSKTFSIFNMWVIDRWNLQYGFILWSNGKIWRWQINNNDLSLWIWNDWVNIVDSWITLPLDLNWWNSFFDSSKCPYLIQWNFLYITAWNWSNHNVHIIDISDNSAWVVLDFIALDRGYKVSYMSNIWDQIIIYATNWDHWKQYFWDGQSESYERHIDWYDRPILWWATINNVDYVITWTWRKRELYQVQWYQAQKLFETDVYVSNQSWDKFYFDLSYWISNLIETIWDTLILPAQEYIYKFGNNKIGLPKNITRDRIWGFPNILYYNDKNSDVLTICSQSSSFSWTFWYYISRQNIRQPNDNSSSFTENNFWIIEWLKFDWWNYALKKEGVKFKIWYSLDLVYNSSTTRDMGINIYARIDDWYEYVNFYTYVYNNSNYTTKPEIWAVYRVDNQDFEIYDITDRNDRLSNWDLQEIKNLWLILHCRCTNKRYSIIKQWSLSWTLVKQSWIWDSSVRYYYTDEWYELVGKIRALNNEDFESKQKMEMLKKTFHQIQFKFDLFTNSSTITPVLQDFYLQYNIIENDIWQ